MIPRDGPGITGTPQDAVCDRLIERYQHFTEKERQLRAEGKEAEAEGAHRYATWVIRAYAAEAKG